MGTNPSLISCTQKTPFLLTKSTMFAFELHTHRIYVLLEIKHILAETIYVLLIIKTSEYRCGLLHTVLEMLNAIILI